MPSAGSLSAKTLAAKQRRIDGAGVADRERANRNAGRHLHDGIKRVLSRQGLRFHRHAEHRQAGQRGSHAGQMRRAAGAGNDHLEAFRFRTFGEGIKTLGRAMRGNDAGVVADAERIERFGGMLHGLPVGLAAHDNGYGFRFRRRHDNIPCAKEATDYRRSPRGGKAKLQRPVIHWRLR